MTLGNRMWPFVLSAALALCAAPRFARAGGDDNGGGGDSSGGTGDQSGNGGTGDQSGAGEGNGEGGATDHPKPVAHVAKKAKLGAGLRIRYVFVPTALLNLFLDHSTAMSSVGVGAELVRRKGDFDIVFGLEYEDISPSNGLYLNKGDKPDGNCGHAGGTDCPDFVEFRSLGLLGVDASFIWHVEIVPRFEFRYGAGIGVGAVLGDIIQHKTNCTPGTTVGDLGQLDPAHCSENGTVKTADKPPVVPIVNVQVGFRYRINDKITVNLDGGFRNMFYTGLGTAFMF